MCVDRIQYQDTQIDKRHTCGTNNKCHTCGTKKIGPNALKIDIWSAQILMQGSMPRQEKKNVRTNCETTELATLSTRTTHMTPRPNSPSPQHFLSSPSSAHRRQILHLPSTMMRQQPRIQRLTATESMASSVHEHMDAGTMRRRWREARETRSRWRRHQRRTRGRDEVVDGGEELHRTQHQVIAGLVRCTDL